MLTNGDEYRLYNSHAKVDIDEKLFRTVRLSDPEQTDLCVETLALCARERMGEAELDVLWKSQFVDRRVQATLEELFADETEALTRLVRKRCGELTLAEVRDSLRRAQVHVHFPAVTLPASTEAHPAPDPEVKPATAPVSYSVQLHELIDAGLLQPPLSLEKTYKSVRLEAIIEADGRVRFAEWSYDSLSTAGGMARKSVIWAPPGRLYPQTNGWTFWLYRDAASGELRSVDELRQQYLHNQA